MEGSIFGREEGGGGVKRKYFQSRYHYGTGQYYSIELKF